MSELLSMLYKGGSLRNHGFSPPPCVCACDFLCQLFHRQPYGGDSMEVAVDNWGWWYLHSLVVYFFVAANHGLVWLFTCLVWTRVVSSHLVTCEAACVWSLFTVANVLVLCQSLHLEKDLCLLCLKSALTQEVTGSSNAAIFGNFVQLHVSAFWANKD